MWTEAQLHKMRTRNAAMTSGRSMGKTYVQLGREFGLSRARARQIVIRENRRFKEALQKAKESGEL